MMTTVRRMTMLAGAGAMTAMLVVGGAGAAHADAPAPTRTPSGEKQVTAICAKVHHRLERVDALRTRLSAGADTKGSIAHLEQRIAKARAAHEDTLVTLLENRLAIRKQLSTVTLPALRTKLAQAEATCTAAGH